MSKKPSTMLSLKHSKAFAEVAFSKQETIDMVSSGMAPYHEILSFAKAAALLGIRKTTSLIPGSSEPAIKEAKIQFFFDGLKITIEAELHAISKRRPDLHVLHAASIAALTIFDALVDEDEGLEITQLRLERSKRQDYILPQHLYDQIHATIVVCSDSVFCGQAYDFSGKAIKDRLQSYGISNILTETVPDEVQAIQEITHKARQSGSNLLIFTGGTGLSQRDVTPDAIAPLLTRPIDGIMEAARRYGQDRIPYAMLSRGVAGFIEDTLTMTFPGSKSGVEEYMDALFPAVLHLFQVNKGQRH